ncbi:hydrogenase maturation nickel metallochaperone HypA [Campylobacter hyointestinalis]|uniref:hydrogenase maturation nickel metallochaperone HypA n=1 Tax=Campylobacter hyointestinalis TaxID=198 RepID=UPI002552BE20|nr:hydrogenase maturation nickel metallochaperone HypA [Campylobacter hyointestinalis]MDL2346786.1 hydrogenase maturation nickel metallochaperone HypA [Campylobacter hyointestinalis]MDL2348603.1 hydrogenase maturation nickel metallochaperone HypA [Campylobacter hyointestinalis]MDL2350272.1 hydrogenase maturation nickel metallochaperone HypA [Campylobacter hyointestinalis]MDM1026179.1 hydrogenase maturation nickel metallochaperone HypA [Campylobacter hyointestinalis]MDM1027354.1 hydrogenase mat
MHELAIVQDLFKLCETNAMKNNARKVTRVEVQIGRLSGVEPHYLESAFDAFKINTICNDAKLIVSTQDVIVKCGDCGFEGVLLENSFLCPKCGANKLDVVAGEDMYLMRLEME